MALYNCQTCNEPDNDEMVQCDKCDEWHHHICVNVTEASVKDILWLCPKCDTTVFQKRSKIQRSPIAQPSKKKEKEATDLTTILTTMSRQFEEKLSKAVRESEERSQRNISSVLAATTSQFNQIMALIQQKETTTNTASKTNNYTGTKPKLPRESSMFDIWNPDRSANIEFPESNRNQEPEISLQPPPVNSTGIMESYLAKLVTRQALPDLPEFDGAAKDWPYFKISYEQTVEAGGYSPIERVGLLRKSLKGEAKLTVADFVGNVGSADEMMKTLELTYGDIDTVVLNLIQEVKAVKDPKRGNPRAIIPLGQKLRSLVSNIKTMQCDDYLRNPSLIHEIVMKLKDQMQIEWSNKKRRMLTTPTLEDLSDWLQVHVQNAVRLVNDQHSQVAFSKDNHTRHPLNVYTEINQPNNEPNRNCPICSNDDHKIYNCEDFKTMPVQKRWRKVKELQLRLCCLTNSRHKSTECPIMKKPCGINGCKWFHHHLLHNTKYDKPSHPDNRTSSLSPSTGTSVLNIGHTEMNEKCPKLFKILELKLYWKDKVMKVFGFLDDGAAPTVIDHSLFQSMGLYGQEHPFCVQYAKGEANREEDSMLTSVFVSAAGSKRKFRMNHIHTIKGLNLPTQSMNIDKLKDKYPYLNGIPMSSQNNVKPMILIGLEHANLIASLETRTGRSDEPIASRTKLGWVVYGKSGNADVDNVTQHINLICNCGEKSQYNGLHDLVKSFFTTESFGVLPQLKALQSKDTEQAEKIINKTMKRVNSRYQIGLFWKHDNVQLQDSYSTAYNRLLSLESKMKKDVNYADWVCKKIDEYVTKDYASIATTDELELKWPRIAYIPIFSVLNLNKSPPKQRLVFDFAAKTKGVSVNSMLVTGPDALASLVGVLFKVREKKFAVGADIEEMFLQIRITKEDQQCQRFLFRNGDNSRPPDTYILRSMGFGPTCSPSAAQTVKNHNAERFRHVYPQAVDAIINQTYVDDYLSSHDDVNEAVEIAKQVIKIHKYAGFNLRSFISNSNEVLMQLPVSNVKENSSNESLNMDGNAITEKLLGMYWNTKDDTLRFMMNHNKVDAKLFDESRSPTKVEVLRTIMQVFDPLGLISFFIIRAKVLMQEIWRAGTDWDCAINNEHHQKWILWFKLLPTLESLKIPRCLFAFKANEAKIEIHTFVDASDSAFAAVSYFRFEHQDTLHVSLISAKTKVAPIKMLSTPRKELQAAVMGARLATSILNEHTFNITKRVFWSDSKVVLAWIASDHRRFQQFVSVRVGEILTLTNQEEWRHVPTKENVADDATKWPGDVMPDCNNRWFAGPSFLKLPSEEWPAEKSSLDVQEELVHKINSINEFQVSFDAIIPENFKSWRLLVRSTAYALRFIKKTSLIDQNSKPFLTVDELKRAENIIIRKVQQESFPSEYLMLQQKIPVQNKSKLFSLSPKLGDDDVIRLCGRIDNAPGIKFETKHPAILPNDHHETRLIILHLHETNFHQGQETVVWKSRRKYWIIKVRSVVKFVKKNCLYCKERGAKPNCPLMGQLPTCRLTTNKKIFALVGMDFFGPIAVVVGRSRQKRWALIIVCMVTRAIHIELVEDMTTSSCIMAFRNFTLRRGQVEEIWSDNGTNFHGAESELRRAAIGLESELSEAAAEMGTKWHFNPPGAPHFGGIWERLIQIVKKCLFAILKNETPRVETLRNALIEAEYVVNSRPLTHNPVDHVDEQPLTPNALLIQSSLIIRSPASLAECKSELKMQWKIGQRLANNFWHRWSSECLPLLTRRSKWFKDVKSLEIGDLVYIIDPNAPRCEWKKGIIDKVFPGKDGIVRAAAVKTDKKVYVRPSVKLALIDIAPTSTNKQFNS